MIRRVCDRCAAEVASTFNPPSGDWWPADWARVLGAELCAGCVAELKAWLRTALPPEDDNVRQLRRLCNDLCVEVLQIPLGITLVEGMTRAIPMVRRLVAVAEAADRWDDANTDTSAQRAENDLAQAVAAWRGARPVPMRTAPAGPNAVLR